MWTSYKFYELRKKEEIVLLSGYVLLFALTKTASEMILAFLIIEISGI